MSVDRALADIDATLESWESGVDAARWHPDGGPDKLAEEDAADQLTRQVSAIMAAAAEFGRMITVTITPNMVVFVKRMNAMGHAMHACQLPHLHRHCVICHPEALPPPLAINGREYHRRQLARRKRR
jgi:hypothetical protein